MIKRILVLSTCIFCFTVSANENIILKDVSGKAKVTHGTVVGCEETPASRKQREDIKKIREDLGRILAKLSKMEKQSKGRVKKAHSKVSKRRGKRSKVHSKKPKTYITVRVKAGDSLSSYAKKYYGDKRKYYRIYRANRDKIGHDLKLKVGDRIVIPISKSYKYKKFKKQNRRANKIEIRETPKIVEKPKVVEERVEIVYTPSPTTSITVYTPAPMPNYSMERIKREKSRDIEVLDKPVYIDDNGLDSSDFIPLDDN